MSCGQCDKTIRMREDTNIVLCTAILEVVEANFSEVCEHYEERSKHQRTVIRKRS